MATTAIVLKVVSTDQSKFESDSTHSYLTSQTMRKTLAQIHIIPFTVARLRNNASRIQKR